MRTQHVEILNLALAGVKNGFLDYNPLANLACSVQSSNRHALDFCEVLSVGGLHR